MLFLKNNGLHKEFAFWANASWKWCYRVHYFYCVSSHSANILLKPAILLKIFLKKNDDHMAFLHMRSDFKMHASYKFYI